jgi:hypothetical protein
MCDQGIINFQIISNGLYTNSTIQISIRCLTCTQKYQTVEFVVDSSLVVTATIFNYAKFVINTVATNLNIQQSGITYIKTGLVTVHQDSQVALPMGSNSLTTLTLEKKIFLI